MDLARAPRRTARKKGSGYENGQISDIGPFLTMATCSKRSCLSAEDVLVVLEDRNESNSERGGMSSGEESDIDRQLMDLDESMR